MRAPLPRRIVGLADHQTKRKFMTDDVQNSEVQELATQEQSQVNEVERDAATSRASNKSALESNASKECRTRKRTKAITR